jgi:hypothetical protein
LFELEIEGKTWPHISKELFLKFCKLFQHFNGVVNPFLSHCHKTNQLSQPHFGQVWGWSPTFGKVGDLESSGTPECLELDSKAQNTSHWGVLGVIGKVLKRKYRKWPRIGHSDICSPSYGQRRAGSQTGNLTPDH